MRREREREKERDIFANIPGRVRASIRHLSRGGYPRFKGKVSGADDLSMPRLRTSRRKWITSTRSEASLSLSLSLVTSRLLKVSPTVALKASDKKKSFGIMVIRYSLSPVEREVFIFFPKFL